jgi:hypothetical protein
MLKVVARSWHCVTELSKEISERCREDESESLLSHGNLIVEDV